MTVTTHIDGALAGTGKASNFPGGSAGSIAFLLEHLSTRGIPVLPGTWVSTGAVSGVHEISPGSTATADFGGLHSISCRIVAATGRG
jgi:2-keto-4-pentenoate hydratase